MYKQCDPQRCTISMGGREEGYIYSTSINENMHFIVIVKDESGDRVTEGGYKVSIQVQLSQNYPVPFFWEGEALGSQLANTWEALAVRDNGDGSYTFNYCPVQPGLCSLSVIVEGQPIYGSPFQWQVYHECDRRLGRRGVTY